ncbi:hypothetical protein D3C72_2478840 [compost metagenome]
MMLHDRQHDLVALADMRHAPAIGHGVDRLGRRFGEDHFVHRSGIEEAAHLLARRLISIRRRIGKEMQAAMHIGIFA